VDGEVMDPEAIKQDLWAALTSEARAFPVSRDRGRYAEEL